MTAKEWIIFILFNITINVLLQMLAWKIAIKLSKKEGANNDK